MGKKGKVIKVQAGHSGMTHDEYMKIIKDEFWPKSYFPITEQSARSAAMNWVASMAGELQEIPGYSSRENYVLEAGDTYFYLFSLADVLGITLGNDNDLEGLAANPSYDFATRSALWLCGHVAGWAIRGRRLHTNECVGHLLEIVGCLSKPMDGVFLAGVREANINKLRGGGAGWQKEVVAKNV